MSNESRDRGSDAQESLPEVLDDKDTGNVKSEEIVDVSSALAAAIAEQNPKMLSMNLLPLWWIMGIGYLISTMNGFGMIELFP